MNKYQEIAKKRIEEIEYSTARIKAKIEAKHPRKADLEKRLAEYEESRALLEFTLKTGRPVLLKGSPTDAGISVEPPAGNLKVKGG